jgi:hypothetical protein
MNLAFDVGNLTRETTVAALGRIGLTTAGEPSGEV